MRYAQIYVLHNVTYFSFRQLTCDVHGKDEILSQDSPRKELDSGRRNVTAISWINSKQQTLLQTIDF